MIAEIRALDPKPAASYDATPPQLVVPDVLMRAGADGVAHRAQSRHDAAGAGQRAVLCAGCAARAQGGSAVPGRAAASANWLVRSLQQRAQTILKVAAEIMRQQDGFLRHGVAHLRPLILRDIAEAVEMHESTVSRVTANKYIATPRGTFELKYFFTTAIAGTDGESHSAEAVRHRIRALIDAETADDDSVR